MTLKTRNIILGIACLEIIFTIGLLALPATVRAIPGAYYVRLQHHPLTASIIELITTPLPTALPTAVMESIVINIDTNDLLAIPGLQETIVPRKTPTSIQFTSTPSVIEVTAVSETEVLSTPQSTLLPTLTSPLVLPPPPISISISGLVTVQQGFNNCGPANLTIVLNYFGDATTQEDAASYLKPNKEDRNVSPWQISDYVNSFTTLNSTVHSGGNLETIKQLVANGLPVVIEKGYEPNNGEGWYGHYLTVYGYDDKKQEIYTRDTYLGPFDGSPRVDTYDDFLYWWQQFNYTFYVVYPPSQENIVMSLIPKPLQDPITMWQYTADLARKEIRDSQDNAFAWFNLGVSLTRIGEITGEASYYEEAAATFDQARLIGLPPRTLYYEHRPLMAYLKTGRVADVLELTDTLLRTIGGPWIEEIHWYRGHALAAQGKLTLARESYEEALRVNPNFYYAQISLDWVNTELNNQ